MHAVPSSVLLISQPLHFFFSSRRRHTRCSRDWSSDVCSSDLSTLQNFLVGVECHLLRLAVQYEVRSEERRVGKECRSCRWWEDYKKKCGPIRDYMRR